MVFTVIREAGQPHDEVFVFKTLEDFAKATFNPSVDIKFVTDFAVRGKTYAERKEFARGVAINLQYAIGDAIMSWGELGYMQGGLERIGKSYGLLEEFRVNGLI